MPNFQQRVYDEKMALDIKLSALRMFLHGVVFYELPSSEQARLLRQENLMTCYSEVLGERISEFE